MSYEKVHCVYSSVSQRLMQRLIEKVILYHYSLKLHYPIYFHEAKSFYCVIILFTRQQKLLNVKMLCF